MPFAGAQRAKRVEGQTQVTLGIRVREATPAKTGPLFRPCTKDRLNWGVTSGERRAHQRSRTEPPRTMASRLGPLVEPPPPGSGSSTPLRVTHVDQDTEALRVTLSRHRSTPATTATPVAKSRIVGRRGNEPPSLTPPHLPNQEGLCYESSPPPRRGPKFCNKRKRPQISGLRDGKN